MGGLDQIEKPKKASDLSNLMHKTRTEIWPILTIFRDFLDINIYWAINCRECNIQWYFSNVNLPIEC